MSGTDQVLIYNVAPFREYGFGVPNFGDKMHTVNAPLHGLAKEVAKVQLSLMTHVDAGRSQYPSVNTVTRLGKILNRIKSVLLSRQKGATAVRLEEGHANPAKKFWSIHPTPYFPGPMVENHWMQEYNNLTMIALCNMYQHSDNNLALTITTELASDIWRYFAEIQTMLAGELLGLSSDVFSADTFRFTEEHYKTYAPEAFIVRTEDGDEADIIRLTETDLAPFRRGIPANLIVSNLASYPVSSNDNFAGTQNANDPDGKVDNPTVGTEDGSALEPVL